MLQQNSVKVKVACSDFQICTHSLSSLPHCGTTSTLIARQMSRDSLLIPHPMNVSLTNCFS